MKLGFSRQVFEKYPNIKKIRPMGAELFHADRRTDRQTDEANIGLSQFRERAKKRYMWRGFLTFTHLTTKINTAPQDTALPEGITYTPLYLFVV